MKGIMFLVVVLLALLSMPQAHRLNILTPQSFNWNSQFWIKAKRNGNYDAFKKLGLSEHQIYTLLYKKKSAINIIRQYFSIQKFVAPYFVYQKVKDFVDYLNHIDQKYLSQFNNVVLGQGNSIRGQGNFLRGNNINLKGDQNFVLTKRPASINGDNILFLGKYEIDMDRVQEIKNCVKCVVKVKH